MIESSAYQGMLPFEAASATSHEAAVSMAGTAASMRVQVLRFIVKRGARGVIDDEVERSLGMRHQTASARRRELELSGHVERTDRRRATRSGRTAAVYVATDKGREWATEALAS